MTLTAPIRTLIVDDDASARLHVRDLLAAHSDVDIVRECVDGAEAVDTLREGAVDLVFLDVQMPGLNGFDVLTQAGAARIPSVIFMSGYSEYAVRAFEAYALDYLLKPFDATRLAMALDRAREHVAIRRARAASPTISSAIDVRLVGLLEHLERERVAYPEAIAIGGGNEFAVIRVEDIDWIEADGSYAKVYVQQRPRLITKTLATLEKDVLDPDIFVRVHRSAIVNTSRIVTAEPHAHGDVTLTLRGGIRVECSRRYRKNLEGRLYFTR